MVGSSLSGAFDYGTERIFEINKNIEIGIDPPQLVKVRFVLFPVEDWYKIPNKEKRELNITKRSGLSILRNQREIDFGWYFFGNKRRENYDDWWRAELNFEPELDEAFGVTHTKQGINPTKYIKDILSPDLERIALDLSRLVRDTFVKIKINNTKLGSINKISIRDKMYPSPKNNSNKMKIVKSNFIKPIIEYNIRYESLFTSEVFQYNYLKNKFDLTMNKDHPFYEFLIFPLMGKYFRNNLSYSNILEILIFSMARAETHSNDEDFKNKLNDFRNLWGDIFAAYIL